ncbi:MULTISPECIES: hypothetical protein [Bradyrhizobium]|jgi:hypothetical protein|nr:hypothetical protein [Bradyrhizobium diazoefficiens]MBP1065721.1 hypothetical protein [Bradyrhizobium japonicum]AWO91205.2 hypothetical protein DI395_23685 [Bradyrhizobium diazoefficiens]QLD44005.1 hypothetical protein HUW42_24795 [Bradyrhizobium diazoefficiens]WLA70297.1 hypothetical protein QIH77_25700 [Bradyrhizobium diazoefficiens]WLB34337.1 hypothetical protein QIH78_22770 [Bradyrhizobium diazoefficiens]
MADPEGAMACCEATERGLSLRLGGRFQGALPADLGDRLAGLDRDELKQVLRRSATAASVDEAITIPVGTEIGR